MTGEEVYAVYCDHGALLSEARRKNEALPAWAFLPDDLKDMWDGIAEQIREWYDEQ